MPAIVVLLTFGVIPIVHTFLPVFWEIEHTRALLLYITILLIILSSLLFHAFKNESYKLKLNYLDILILLFFVINVVSVIFSNNFYAAIFGAPLDMPQGSLLFLSGLIFLYYYYCSITTKRLFIVAACATLLAALYEVIFSFFDPSNVNFFKGLPIRATAYDNSPISFANFLMISAPLAMSLAIYWKNKILKTVTLVALVAILSVIILSLTRSVWIVTLFQIGILTYFLVKLRLTNFKQLIQKKYMLGTFAILFGIGLYLAPIITNKITSILTEDPSYNSAAIRIKEYKSALKIIGDYPILGVGPEGVAYLGNQYKSPKLNKNEQEWNWPLIFIRNYYLHLGAINGAAGLLVFLVILIYFIKLFFQQQANLIGKKESIILVGFFCSWLSIIVHYFFYAGTTISQLFFWQISGLLAGEIINHNKSVLIEKTIPAKIVKIFLLPFIVFFLFVLVFIYKDYQSQIYYQKSIGNTDFEEKIKDVEKAITLNPYNMKYQRRYVGIITVLIVNAMNEDKTEIMPINQMIIDGQKHLDFAKRVDPYNPDLALEQAFLSNIKFMHLKNDKTADRTPAFNKAEQDIKFAYALDPTNPLALDTLTTLYLDYDGKKIIEAENTARETMRLKYTYLHAHHHLGEALKQQGRFEEAVDAYKQALVINPDDQISTEQIEIIRLLQSK